MKIFTTTAMNTTRAVLIGTLFLLLASGVGSADDPAPAVEVPFAASAGETSSTDWIGFASLQGNGNDPAGEDPTAERLNKLAVDEESLRLQLSYVWTSRKLPPPHELFLTAAFMEITAADDSFLHAQLARGAERIKLIKGLAQHGFLRNAKAGEAKLDGDLGYVLRVSNRAYAQYEVLGQGAAMRDKLTTLRKLLSGDAAKAMDRLLGQVALAEADADQAAVVDAANEQNNPRGSDAVRVHFRGKISVSPEEYPNRIQQVIRNELGLAKLLKEKDAKQAIARATKALDVKMIDFDRQMVIAVSAGPIRPRGGWPLRLDVTTLQERNGELHVQWAITRMLEHVDDPLVHPVRLILAKKYPGKVVFDSPQEAVR